jgi:hypothetical protein
MKLFGNFLVERNEISSSDLVEALIRQLRDLPTVAEIIHKKKLISDQDQLKVLTYQSQYRCEYIAACRHFGLWGDQIETAVMREIKSCRKPIGQILVEQSKINAEKLTGLLDEFIAEVPREERVRRQNVAETQTKLESSTTQPPQTDSDLQGFAPSFSRVAISDPVLREFFEIFDSNFMKRVKGFIDELGKNDGMARPRLVDLQGDIVTAAASSRFVRLPLLSKLFGAIEALVSNESIESSNRDIRKDLEFAFEVAWEIRKQVSQDETEETYWSGPLTKSRFITAIKRLEIASDAAASLTTAA